MSKLIRHAQKRGTALFLAMQLTGLILLSLLTFIGGPQQSPKAPAETQVSGPAETQTGDLAQAQEANNNNNNLSSPASGLLPRERASNSSFIVMEAPAG